MQAITSSTRLGWPADIAAVVAMRLSEDGRWIHGQLLNVKDGAVMRQFHVRSID
jgi:hypothetical protein